MTPEKTKALTGYEYNAVLNPGPLISVKDGVLANGAPRITTPYLTFLGGKYSEFITEQNTKLYRAVSSNQKYIKLKNGDIGHGTGSYAGAFYVDQPFVSKLQGRIDAAILPEWSDMTKMEVVELKKGTKYFKGPIAPQGDVFLGGQDKMQTYLLPEARKMVRVLEVKELK